MRVLIGCEHSGVVRDAFRARGHNAYSCDILPATGSQEFHLSCDVFEAIAMGGWDLAIFHPPCTYLCSSGLHWNKRVPGRSRQTDQAVEFVRRLMDCSIPLIAVENPIGCLSTRLRKPDQIIQPWMFGHPESKATCLWLKGLPPLIPTNILPLPVSGRWANQTASGQNRLPPTKDRWAIRSKTYDGIAEAFAKQWGGK